MKISTFLPHGAENAIPARDLAAVTGLSLRALRAAIVKGRAAREQILYRPGREGGYFLPSADPEQAQRERLAFFRVQNARAICTFKTLRPVARALGIPAGQIGMEDATGPKHAGEGRL